MPYRLLLTVVLLSACYGISAQNRQKFISLETGYAFIDCQAVVQDYLRADRSLAYNYDSHTYARDVEGTMYKFHGGVRVELRSKNNKFGFLTGLRYTQLSSAIRRTGSLDYFYVLYDQSGTTTEYLRVKEIKQMSSYLGVPLEVRFYPLEPRRITLYFFAGGETGWRVATKNKIEFSNAAMNPYASGVSEIAGGGKSFYGAAYAGAGVTVGKQKPLFSPRHFIAGGCFILVNFEFSGSWLRF
ncbi:MAG TPA: outer membrane beta-barrel protein [Chryseolinea sp.]